MGAGVTYDTWGGSWGNSWGVSWGQRQKPMGFIGPFGGRRRRKHVDAEQVTQYAREISEQLDAEAITPAKAENIANRTDRLKSLLSESELKQEYLLAIVDALAVQIRQAIDAAEIENRRRQLIEAARLAAKLEADLRDEEDTLVLFMVH